MGFPLHSEPDTKIHRWQPDIVHVHDQPEPRSLWIAPHRTTVLTIHDPVPHPGAFRTPHVVTCGSFDWTERRWRSRADAVIVHSSALKEELQRLTDYARIEVVPHGVAVADAAYPVPSEPVIAFLGKLMAYKGLEILEAAMPRVWARRPDVRFLVAGRGECLPTHCH